MTLGQYLWDFHFWWLCVGFVYLAITVALAWSAHELSSVGCI